jgi:hypothetical protein
MSRKIPEEWQEKPKFIKLYSCDKKLSLQQLRLEAVSIEVG